MSTAGPVLAAGTLVWREPKRGSFEVLLIHRPYHHDVSFPKGKVDPGESLPETAARELHEETGLRLALGVPLGTVEYTLPNGRQKQVSYWAAEATEKALAGWDFHPNDEVEELRWVRLEKTAAELTYEHDADVLERFASLATSNSARTFAIIALRHGKAAPHQGWLGPDRARPLADRGAEQARAIANGIAAYRPKRLVSSPAARCQSTIAPTAATLGRAVELSDAISEDAFLGDGHSVAKVVAKRLRKGKTTVLCSHSPVLPQIIAAVAHGGRSGEYGAYPRMLPLDTGEYAVLHVSRADPLGGLVGIEVHRPGV